jgi:hypothetical protein
MDSGANAPALRGVVGRKSGKLYAYFFLLRWRKQRTHGIAT